MEAFKNESVFSIDKKAEESHLQLIYFDFFTNVVVSYLRG